MATKKETQDAQDALVLAALPQAGEAEVKPVGDVPAEKPPTKSPELQAFVEQKQAENTEGGGPALALGLVPEGTNTLIASGDAGTDEGSAS